MHRGEKLGSQKLVLDTIRGWPSQLRFSTRTQLRFFERFGGRTKGGCTFARRRRHFVILIFDESLKLYAKHFFSFARDIYLFRPISVPQFFLKNSRREEKRGRSSTWDLWYFSSGWNIVGKNRGVLQNWWHSSMIWSSYDGKKKSKETEELKSKYSISRTKKLINSCIFEYSFVIFIFNITIQINWFFLSFDCIKIKRSNIRG